jgi:hypothetical protein
VEKRNIVTELSPDPSDCMEKAADLFDQTVSSPDAVVVVTETRMDGEQ